MSQQNQQGNNQDKDKSKAASASGTSQSGDPGRTPGAAEGDRDTVEQDIDQKLGGEKNQQ